MSDDKGYKVFVGGIHLETSKDTLRDYFEQFGNLTDAVVMRDGMTDKSRGFGFVTYESEEERNACINGKPHILDGKEVEAKVAVPREPSAPVAQSSHRTRKVFLGGISPDTTKEDIRAVMEPHGKLIDVQVMTEKGTEKPRGFGFAIFEDADDVDKLCTLKYCKIKDRDVEVKKAISQDEIRRSGGDKYSRSGGGGGDMYGYGGRGGGGGGGGDAYGGHPRSYYPKMNYRDYPMPAGYDYRYTEGDYMRAGYMSGGGAAAGGYGMAAYPDTRTYQGYGSGYQRYAAGGYDMSAYNMSAYGGGSSAGGSGGASMGTYSNQSPSGYGPSRGVYGAAESKDSKEARGNGTRGFHPYRR